MNDILRPVAGIAVPSDLSSVGAETYAALCNSIRLEWPASPDGLPQTGVPMSAVLEVTKKILAAHFETSIAKLPTTLVKDAFTVFFRGDSTGRQACLHKVQSAANKKSYFNLKPA
jgi:hypothetical protein